MELERNLRSNRVKESTAASDTRSVTPAVIRVSASTAIGVLIAVPVLIGVATGVIMRPREGWRDTLEVAAAGSGVVVLVVLVAIVAALISQPSSCSHGHCNDSDNAAGVQAVFALVFVPVLYPFVLLGAAIGKLLWRGVRRLV